MTPRFVFLFQQRLLFLLHEVEIQNDMLMWLMSEAKGVEKSLDGLARRMLFLNLASIHSTSRVRSRTVHPRGIDL